MKTGKGKGSPQTSGATAGKASPEADQESEAQFLERYRPGAFPRPSVTVDLVIFTVIDKLLHVLVVRRNEHPFKGRWALPGGFVRVTDDRASQGEDLDAAAHRELLEETGLSHTASAGIFLEQVKAFGRPGRDPRMRVISVAYYALVRPALVPLIRAGGDASHATWLDVTQLAPNDKDKRPSTSASADLAFDHAAILDAALDRMRADLDRTGVAFELVPETFTIQELRAVHEAVRDEPLDPGNFRKRILRLIEDGIIEPARGKRPTASKPASVYRFVRPAAKS